MSPARRSEGDWRALLNPLEAWRRELRDYSLAKFQQDLLAGLTVGVVALPLALAFGVTSGAGPRRGCSPPSWPGSSARPLAARATTSPAPPGP